MHARAGARGEETSMVQASVHVRSAASGVLGTNARGWEGFPGQNARRGRISHSGAILRADQQWHGVQAQGVAGKKIPGGYECVREVDSQQYVVVLPMRCVSSKRTRHSKPKKAQCSGNGNESGVQTQGVAEENHE
jgi:hypothetical protein